MAKLHKRIRHHLQAKKKSYLSASAAVASVFLMLAFVFTVTRGSNPLVSELSFTEKSVLGIGAGSVIPASCESGGNNLAGSAHTSACTWTEYCTGASDPSGNNWQIWEYSNDNTVDYRNTGRTCAPSGTLTVNPTTCTIPSGAATCASWPLVTYTATNVATWATVWDNVNSAARAGGTSGSFNDHTISNETRTYYLRDGSESNGTLLAQASVTGVCESGSSWNGYSCYAASSSSGSNPSSSNPDLVAGAVTPTAATVGVSSTFSSVILNNASVSTGSGFNNFFQFIDGTGTTYDLPSQSMSALSAGGSGNTTYTYTPTGAGTFSLRACADKSDRNSAGSITESDENNNCGPWTTVIFSCPSGTSWSGTACVAASSYLDIFFND